MLFGLPLLVMRQRTTNEYMLWGREQPAGLSQEQQRANKKL